MTQKDEALKMAIETLENNKPTHYYCDDTWYSCPKHEEGCANAVAGKECNCGADRQIAAFDKAIKLCKAALSEDKTSLSVEQNSETAIGVVSFSNHSQYVSYHTIKVLPDGNYHVYTSPPKREWGGLSEHELIKIFDRERLRYQKTRLTENNFCLDLMKAIEAKLKELNHD